MGHEFCDAPARVGGLDASCFRAAVCSLLGKDVNPLAQGVNLSLHDVETLALRRFLSLRRVIVGSECLDLLRQVG